MTVAAPPPPVASDQPLEQAPALFNRPPRVLLTLPADEVEIPGPPQEPAQRVGVRLISIIIPLASALIYLAIAFARSGFNGGGLLSTLLSTLPIVLIALITGGAAFFTFRQQQRDHDRAVEAYKESYQRALERTRSRLQKLERQQRSYYEENNPDLGTLLQIAHGERTREGLAVPAARLWARRPADADFLCLRVGRGDRPTSLTIKPPSVSAYSKDVEDSLKLADQFRQVHDVPIDVSLRDVGSLGIAGPSGHSLNVLQALLWQIAVHHAPSEVRIAAFWEANFDDSWEWLRYLPHTRPLDGDDSYRLLARYDRNPEDMQRVIAALAKEIKRRAEAEDAQHSRRPHLVVVLSDYQLHHTESALFAQCIAGRSLDVSAICLVPEVRDVPGECGGYIDLALGGSPEHARLGLAGPGGGYSAFKADVSSTAQSNEIARLLAPVELADADGGREMPRNVQLLALLNIPDAARYQPADFWGQPLTASWHPVPVGLKSADAAVEIDLNEGVHGVHGMIAGATGAGKSELLLSFLMSLAIRHHPDRLNFLLIDFKGGATFRDISRLPHTAGMVTDLSGFLAERALIAMNSELDRRKRLLAKVGLPNIKSYRKAGVDQHGAPLPPLPNLFIAIDEFDEMIRDYPQFQDELIRVGKQGRSLGVHLLLATQQPSLIKEGLLNNLSYWMSLRVNSREDSKAMVGLPDAAMLGTDTPGRGYFRDKNSGVRMFQSALITAPYRPSVGRKSFEVDITGHVRVNTSETRARQMLQILLDQLLEQLKGTFSEARMQQIIGEATAEICAQFNLAFDLEPDAEQLAEQRQIADEEIRRLLSSVTRLDPNQRNEAEAIEEQISITASQTTDRLRGDSDQRSEIEVIAAGMIDAMGERYAAARYRIWAEPLPAILPLADMPQYTRLAAGEPAARPRDTWLDVPYGLLDNPEDARYDLLRTDLAGAGGNLFVLGSQGSGKTTLLQTVVIALAYAHSPADLWFYIIDNAGNGLGMRDKLPHLAQALAPRQHLLIERLLVEIQDQIENRRSHFQHYGVANIVQYRERRARQPEQIPDPPPAIVVVIDSFYDLVSQNDQITDVFRSLMRECRAYGIYFVITASAVRDVGQLSANFETRIALRLNSEGDSAEQIGKDYASKLIKPEQAGRAFVRSSPRPREAQIALPSLQIRAGASPAATSAEETEVAYSDVASEIATSLDMVAEKWQAAPAMRPDRAPRPLRLLPTSADLAPLMRQISPTPAARVPLGIDGATLQPLPWNLDQTAHLLVTGALRSGKSSLLRALLAALAQRFTPDQAEVILVDYTLRALRDFEQLPHTRRFSGLSVGKDTREVALVTEKEELVAVIEQLKGEFAERLALLRHNQPIPRRTILVIHNWDLVAQDNPITSALDTYVRRGSDLGVHCMLSYTDPSTTSGPSLLRAIRTSFAEIVVGRPPSDSAPYTAAIRNRFKSVLASDMPPGRGFVLETGQPPRLAQLVYADPDQIAARLAAMIPTVDEGNQ